MAEGEESKSPCCLLGGQELRVSERAAQLPVCPPHQHIMKYLDFAPYFNGVREWDARNGGCGSVCNGEGKSSGDCSTRMVVHVSQCLFFAREKKRENGGERVGWWWGSKRDYSLLESGFWGTQAQESVNLDSLRGVAGRGVLGGLIRRMLSHHPSRQAAENWLAPRRVEFMGGGDGGGGRNDAERCTRYLSQPLVCFRISAAN